MIFNSNGKTFLNSFKFNKNYLETVKSYCYLGITIKYTGNFNVSPQILMEKGRKAWFKIKNSIGLNNPCSLLEKLFDMLISEFTVRQPIRHAEQNSIVIPLKLKL